MDRIDRGREQVQPALSQHAVIIGSPVSVSCSIMFTQTCLCSICKRYSAALSSTSNVMTTVTNL